MRANTIDTPRLGCAPLFLLLFAQFLWSVVYAASSENIVILKFQNTQKLLKDNEVLYIEENIRAAAANLLPKALYLVYTNENLLELLKANNIDICSAEGECEVDTMRKIQADFGITGQILEFGGKTKVLVKIYDSITGNILGSEEISGKDAKELGPLLSLASTKLLGRIYDFALKEKTQISYKASELGEVKFTVNEDESYIFVDDKPLGVANKNQALIASLPAGKYKLKVYKRGFEEFLDRFDLKKNEKIKKKVILVPQKEGAKKLGESRISIESAPESAASIFFGKQDSGFKTPYTFKNMPAGQYPIMVKKMNYYDQLLAIEVKEGDARTVKTILKEKYGRMKIVSKPPGAMVILDNKNIGVTPFESGRLTSGKYKLVLQNPLYHNRESEVVIADGEVKALDISLTPAFGIISIRSVPDGTEVVIDGEAVGIAPMLDYKIASGEHELTLSQSLYKSFSRTIHVFDNQKQNIKHILEADYGTLSVKSAPVESSIWLNDEKIGTTPLDHVRIPTGPHNLVLKPEDEVYKNYAHLLNITAGDIVPIEVTLDSLKGDLVVSSNPQGADIYIDEKHYGKTPKRISDISAKGHSIRLKLNGYATHKDQVIIKDKDTANVDAELVKAGWAIIHSVPKGAHIYVDDQYYGKTPNEFSVSAQKHRVKLKLAEHEIYEVTIALTETEPLYVNTNLIKIGQGAFEESDAKNDPLHYVHKPFGASRLDGALYITSGIGLVLFGVSVALVTEYVISYDNPPADSSMTSADYRNSAEFFATLANISFLGTIGSLAIAIPTSIYYAKNSNQNSISFNIDPINHTFLVSYGF